MHILDFFLQYLIDIEVSSKGDIFLVEQRYSKTIKNEQTRSSPFVNEHKSRVNKLLPLSRGNTSFVVGDVSVRMLAGGSESIVASRRIERARN